MYDDGIVVVDEERLDRRRHGRIVQVPADVDDVDQARAGRDEVGARQARRRLREREPGAVDQPTARHAELSGERGKREDRADAAAAVAVALEPIADRDHCRVHGPIPLGELAHEALVHAADPRRVRQAVAARERHVVLEPVHVARDELAVEAALPLEIGGHRPREDDVGPGPERDVQIGLLGDLRAPRVDDDELGAPAAGLVDDRHDVQIRPRHVAAPGHDQLRVLGLLGPDARRRTKGADPGLRADTAAERTAVEQTGAEPVKEPKIHRTAGEHPVRAGIIQRQDRLRSVRGDDGREALVDDIERLGPRDALEASLALGARAHERRLEAPVSVDEARIRLRHFRAEHTRRVGVGARAPDRDDPFVLDRHGQAACVWTIERTNTRMLDSHSLPPGGALLTSAHPRPFLMYTEWPTGGRAIELGADRANLGYGDGTGGRVAM